MPSIDISSDRFAGSRQWNLKVEIYKQEKDFEENIQYRKVSEVAQTEKSG
jgi:hypothetical protein